jgi:hypothetical protein
MLRQRMTHYKAEGCKFVIEIVIKLVLVVVGTVAMLVPKRNTDEK